MGKDIPIELIRLCDPVNYSLLDILSTLLSFSGLSVGPSIEGCTGVVDLGGAILGFIVFTGVVARGGTICTFPWRGNLGVSGLTKSSSMISPDSSPLYAQGSWLEKTRTLGWLAAVKWWFLWTAVWLLGGSKV